MTELRRRMDDDMVARGLAEADARVVSVGGHRPGRVLSSIARSDFRRGGAGVSRAPDARAPTVLEYVQRRRPRVAVFLSHHVEARPHDVHDSDAASTGKLPAILSRDEVERVIAHTPNPKHRTMLLTTYAAGLRLNEVLHLRVTDIDSARMTIRVEQGKGGKDRYTVLSAAATRGAYARTGPCRAPAHVAVSVGAATRQPMDPVRPATRLSARRSARRASPSPAAFTACGTRSRRTCSKPASTFTRFNGCSATGTSARPRATFS